MQNTPVSDLPTSVQFDFATGIFAPALDLSERRMSDLAEMYYDQAAVQKMLAGGQSRHLRDPLPSLCHQQFGHEPRRHAYLSG